MVLFANSVIRDAHTHIDTNNQFKNSDYARKCHDGTGMSTNGSSF